MSFQSLVSDVKSFFVDENDDGNQKKQEEVSSSPTATESESNSGGRIQQMIDEVSKLRPQLLVIGYDFTVLRAHLSLFPKVSVQLGKLFPVDISVVELVVEDTTLSGVQKMIISSILRVEKFSESLKNSRLRVASVTITVGVVSLPEVCIDMVPLDSTLGLAAPLTRMSLDPGVAAEHTIASALHPGASNLTNIPGVTAGMSMDI